MEQFALQALALLNDPMFLEAARALGAAAVAFTLPAGLSLRDSMCARVVKGVVTIETAQAKITEAIYKGQVSAAGELEPSAAASP